MEEDGGSEGDAEDGRVALPVPILAICRCARAVPIVLAEELRAALASFPQYVLARRPRTDAHSRSTKRTRRRRAQPAAAPVGAFPVAVAIAEAVGTGLPAVEMRERWRTVRRFLSTFLGQLVLGAFGCLDRVRVRALAVKMVRAQQVEDWRRFAFVVESVGIVWPFLRLVRMGAHTEPLMTRAIAELLIYACDVDALWESEWRRRAPHASTEFESQ